MFKKGFTLAEVLITLGIIGVVAAMTMPVLINKIGDIVIQNQNKKAQSVFANGIKMLMAQEDLTDLKETAIKKCTTKTCITSEIAKAFKVIADNNSNNVIFDTKYKFTGNDAEVWKDESIQYAFATPDGIIFGLQETESDSIINVIVDVNGTKAPNTGGKDLCLYTVSNTGTLAENCAVMENFAPANLCDWDHLDKCNEAQCNALNDSLPSSVTTQNGLTIGIVGVVWDGTACRHASHSGGSGD